MIPMKIARISQSQAIPCKTEEILACVQQVLGEALGSISSSAHPGACLIGAMSPQRIGPGLRLESIPLTREMVH